jgi:hypothetical protein
MGIMEDFLAEFRFDASRHGIGHIGLENESLLFEGNAYHFSQANSGHIYCQFVRYLHQGISAYISVKQECLQIVKTIQPPYRNEQVLVEIGMEIEAFQKFSMELESALKVFAYVEQLPKDRQRRQTAFLQEFRRLDSSVQRLLDAVAYSMSSG